MFMDDFRAQLPAKIFFSSFSETVRSVCMNSSQLRMCISKTAIAETSRHVVISQLSTIIISYLTPKEQMLQAQLVCRKWYRSFVPQVEKKYKINF